MSQLNITQLLGISSPTDIWRSCPKSEKQKGHLPTPDLWKRLPYGKYHHSRRSRDFTSSVTPLVWYWIYMNVWGSWEGQSWKYILTQIRLCNTICWCLLAVLILVGSVRVGNFWVFRSAGIRSRTKRQPIKPHVDGLPVYCPLRWWFS